MFAHQWQYSTVTCLNKQSIYSMKSSSSTHSPFFLSQSYTKDEQHNGQLLLSYCLW